MLRNAEYVLALQDVLKLAPTGRTPAQLRAAFSRVDTDNSGYIDADEVQNLFDDVYGDLPDTEAMVAAAYLIGAGSVPPGSSATFEEMIAAGTFSELRDSELRKALYDYDQSAQLGRAAWQSLRDQSIPYLREISPLLKMRILPSDPSGSVPVGINETMLFGDPDVATALAIIAVGNANDLQLRQMQMERAKAVMAILNPDADVEPAP